MTPVRTVALGRLVGFCEARTVQVRLCVAPLRQVQSVVVHRLSTVRLCTGRIKKLTPVGREYCRDVRVHPPELFELDPGSVILRCPCGVRVEQLDVSSKNSRLHEIVTKFNRLGRLGRAGLLKPADGIRHVIEPSIIDGPVSQERADGPARHSDAP